ncbi:hypothetical protein ABZV77_09915 [Streptomyces sp. NPDC004732]
MKNSPARLSATSRRCATHDTGKATVNERAEQREPAEPEAGA